MVQLQLTGKESKSVQKSLLIKSFKVKRHEYAVRNNSDDDRIFSRFKHRGVLRILGGVTI